jgi:hypothetical protein
MIDKTVIWGIYCDNCKTYGSVINSNKIELKALKKQWVLEGWTFKSGLCFCPECKLKNK